MCVCVQTKPTLSLLFRAQLRSCDGQKTNGIYILGKTKAKLKQDAMTLDKSNSLDTPTLVWSLIYTFFRTLHRSKGFVLKLKNRRKNTGIQLHGFCTPIDCRTMSPWYHNLGCFFIVFVVQSFYEGFDFPTQFPVPLYLGLLCTKVAENNSKTPTKRASAWRSGVWIKDTRPESTMHRTRFVSPWKKRCPTRGREEGWTKW